MMEEVGAVEVTSVEAFLPLDGVVHIFGDDANGPSMLLAEPGNEGCDHMNEYDLWVADDCTDWDLAGDHNYNSLHGSFPRFMHREHGFIHGSKNRKRPYSCTASTAVSPWICAYSFFSGCPSYLSAPDNSTREAPDAKRSRLEASQLARAGFTEQERDHFSSFEELKARLQVSVKLTVIHKEKCTMFLNMTDDREPWLKASLTVFENLQVSACY
ncbi:uncharacterized protein LOC142575076 [Dermacentor variabilis]|uniref:uncharacterized protein LOC142575076 n=1 Tax=Dermacentor variabilis TaxID=34621 RepID=UPI003F5BD61B